jgi:hypothetical protein
MIQVILIPAATLDRNGDQRWFVEIKGIPGRVGALVVSNALLLSRAEEQKRQVEDALSDYRRPKRTARKRPGKTVWERLRAKDV